MAQNRPARRQLPHIWCNALRPTSTSGGSRRTPAKARRSPASHAETQRITLKGSEFRPRRRRSEAPWRSPEDRTAQPAAAPHHRADRQRGAAGNPPTQISGDRLAPRRPHPTTAARTGEAAPSHLLRRLPGGSSRSPTARRPSALAPRHRSIAGAPSVATRGAVISGGRLPLTRPHPTTAARSGKRHRSIAAAALWRSPRPAAPCRDGAK